MRRRWRRGSAMVELALCLAALGPIFYGIMSFGTSCLVRAELMNTARNLARYASTLPLCISDLAAFRDAAAARALQKGSGQTGQQTVSVDIEFERGAPARVRVIARFRSEEAVAIFPYLGEWSP